MRNLKERMFQAFLVMFLLTGSPLNGLLCVESAADTVFRIPSTPPKVTYEIDLRFEKKTETFIGTEHFEFTNDTRMSLTQIAIEWQSGSQGEMVIEDFNSLGRTYSAGRGVTIIELNEPILPGESLDANITFRFPSPQFYDDILILTDWYPRLWWDKNTLDNYLVSITSPEDCVLLTSAPQDASGNTYIADGIRSFGIVLARGYKIAETDSGAVRISILVNENNQDCAEFLLNSTSDSISFFREFHGFYPHETFAIIPGFDEPMGGYPIASGIVGIHGQARMNEKPLSHWRFITAHEVGHQYWMEYVLEAERCRWLMIGLGLYTDREYMLDRGHGDDHERGIVDRYITGVQDGADTRMDLSDDERMEAGFDFNNIVTHGKGFGLISSLACYLGNDRFEKIYFECLNSSRGLELDSDSFQEICERITGENLEWFFDQWIRTNRYLCFEIDVVSETEENGKYLTDLLVRRLGSMEMPVPVDAIFEDGSTQRQFSHRFMKKSILQFISDSPLSELLLDSDGEMPILEKPITPGEVELRRNILSLQYMSDDSDDALRFFEYADVKIIDESWLWMKLGMILCEGNYLDKAYMAFANGLEIEGVDGSLAFVFLTWQGHILDLQDDRTGALLRYEKALSLIEPDSRMTHDQYGIVIDEMWLNERLQTPFNMGLSDSRHQGEHAIMKL